ncbi:MAG: calcium/sodium antiporter [Candidatus Aphodosoma sp.]
MDYLLLIIGFAVLVFAADWLVDGAGGLAKKLNVSDLVIGMTVVAFGTSAPELVISLIATGSGSNEIALTNVLGSNAINTLVILGVSALIYPIVCKPSTFRYEIPLSLSGGILVLLFGTNWFGLTTGLEHGFTGLTRYDGVALLSVMIGFLAYSVHQARIHKDKIKPEETFMPMPIWKAVLFMAGGLAGLIFGGELIVDKATAIASSWGVSDAVIGVTIVALGTSLPELATSAIAAFKHNTDLAIGNVIGSNIFNIFLILGISSIVKPLNIYSNFIADTVLAAGSSLLLMILIALNRHHKLTRLSGIVMLAVYGIYLYYLLSNI